jgi:hypothetical protein
VGRVLRHGVAAADVARLGYRPGDGGAVAPARRFSLVRGLRFSGPGFLIAVRVDPRSRADRLIVASDGPGGRTRRLPFPVEESCRDPRSRANGIASGIF